MGSSLSLFTLQLWKGKLASFLKCFNYSLPPSLLWHLNLSSVWSLFACKVWCMDPILSRESWWFLSVFSRTVCASYLSVLPRLLLCALCIIGARCEGGDCAAGSSSSNSNSSNKYPTGLGIVISNYLCLIISTSHYPQPWSLIHMFLYR